MLGSPILYLKAMRILMFQLSGFYCNQVYLLLRTGAQVTIKTRAKTKSHRAAPWCRLYPLSFLRSTLCIPCWNKSA